MNMATMKSLANAQAKAEMFSLKAAVNAVKVSFEDKEGDTRKYLTEIGYTAKEISTLKWTDVEIEPTKSGKYSTWGVLGALTKAKRPTSTKSGKSMLQKLRDGEITAQEYADYQIAQAEKRAAKSGQCK